MAMNISIAKQLNCCECNEILIPIDFIRIYQNLNRNVMKIWFWASSPEYIRILLKNVLKFWFRASSPELLEFWKELYWNFDSERARQNILKIFSKYIEILFPNELARTSIELQCSRLIYSLPYQATKWIAGLAIDIFIAMPGNQLNRYSGKTT